MKETGKSRCIYQNEFDKACFHNDMTYGYFKDLNRRSFADKVLCDKAFNIAKDQKHDGYQRGIVSMACKVFDKKTSAIDIKNKE